MKILYDGIVKSLQSYGGITVYFEEIIKRLKNDEYKFLSKYLVPNCKNCTDFRGCKK